MEQHISFLKTRCCLCGNQTKGKIDVTDKQSFEHELWLRFQINVDVDREEIHPTVLCPVYKRLLYRRRSAANPSSVSTTKQPFLWRGHDQDSPCYRKERNPGHPWETMSKQQQRNVRMDESETESGEESEIEQEQNSCQQFRTLTQNIQIMDRVGIGLC